MNRLGKGDAVAEKVIWMETYQAQGKFAAKMIDVHKRVGYICLSHGVNVVVPAYYNDRLLEKK